MWIAVPIRMPPCPEVWLSHSLPQVRSDRTVSHPQQPQHNEFASAKWASALLTAHLTLCSHGLGRPGPSVSISPGTQHCKVSIIPTPLRTWFGTISEETKLDKYWYFSLREFPAGREGGSWALPLWDWKEIATALPLETLIQTMASKERELWSCKKEGAAFLYLSLRNGNYDHVAEAREAYCRL